MIENKETNSDDEENSGGDLNSFRNSSYDQNSQLSMEQAMHKLSISAIQNSDSEADPPAKELSTIIETKVYKKAKN